MSELSPIRSSLHDLPDFLAFRVEQAEGGDVGAAVLEVVEVDHVEIEARDEIVVVGRHHHFLRYVKTS